MSEQTLEQKPKLDVLQKEKLKKEQILQTKYQKEFLIEQNKLKRAEVERTEILVKEQEVSARSWKAYWEKMYYSLECEKLQPEYDAYQKRTSEKFEKQKAEYEETQRKLQENLDESKSNLKLSAVPELITEENGLNISELQKEE